MLNLPDFPVVYLRLPPYVCYSSVTVSLSWYIRAVGHGCSHVKGASEVDLTLGFCTGAAGQIEQMPHRHKSSFFTAPPPKGWVNIASAG